MKIDSFGSLDHYLISDKKILLSDANVIKPPIDRLTFKYGFAPTYINSEIGVPPSTVDPLGRGWLKLSPTPAASTSSRAILMYVDNETIPASMKVAGTEVNIGFKIGFSEGIIESGTFIGYRAASTSAISSLSSDLTQTANRGGSRWIDIRFKFTSDANGNVVTLASVYCNKVFVRSITANSTQIFGFGFGSISNSLIIGGSAGQAIYYNDFIVTVKESTDEAKLDIGPITVKQLPRKEVNWRGNWRPPVGKTVEQALDGGVYIGNAPGEEENLLGTDPYGSKLTSTFAYPEDETRPIIALKESFVVQRHASQASSLVYQLKNADGSLHPPVVINIDTAPPVVHTSRMIYPKAGDTVLDKKTIDGLGCVFNSARREIAQ